MWKSRVVSLVIVLLGAGLAFLVYRTEMQGKQFRLGLDLSGGSRLAYQVDLSQVPSGEVKDKMDALRETLERRVNGADISGVLGVGENVVQIEGGDKIVVELPGITDPLEANKKIGKTPLLEFKEERKNFVPKETSTIDDMYVSTGLTGQYLVRASVQFDPQSQPYIALEFDDAGKKLFADITKRNVNKTIAIYLDGVLTQAPVVETAITDGQAIITGVTAEEARQHVKELNLGALPVPIELVSTDSIGPSLGADAVSAGIKSGLIGFLAIVILLTLWYRVPGLIASLALLVYGIVTIAIFKFLPVTLTAPGIAGFIISLGMAVDANILIFERMKEELHVGKDLGEAIRIGFDRAWLSIRDGNVSSMISAFVLYAFGTTLIQGFALTFGIGVLVSMLSAILVSKVFLKTVGGFAGKRTWFFKSPSFEKNNPANPS